MNQKNAAFKFLICE